MKNYKIDNSWLTAKPFYITGPCSAESFEQLDKVANKLIKLNLVSAFRAGVWKPRTDPNSFEGKGITALKWLKAIKEKYNIPIATEVLSPEHVVLCEKYNVDIIWLGARTVTNPYLVKEISDNFKNKNFIVLLKNPVLVDIKLWLGALERVLNSGISKVALIHRGFFPNELSKYRNIPRWEVIIDIKCKYKDLLIFCDPSHMAGNRKYIREIFEKSADFCYDGYMVEVHNMPKKALSDADQQITPLQLKKITENIKFCYNNNLSQNFQIIMLRENIDSIDSQLLELLSKRMSVVKELAKIKKQINQPAFQRERWEQIVKSRIKEGVRLKLNKDFLFKLLNLIHLESIRMHKES
ncbi:MAG: bifunctional 3-deoxy-7-phosphoheptulonate synthase/chorismate mutase type II [Bacteroidales bacterium]|nr:bifunctional 3-deoxy-7-phosphoheptulonate synthase/chorismate mutase type II [Bacteroidales bacterium]